MSKRITYLQRRADLPAADFSEHWRHAHAQIAVDLPGAVGYRQNHVLPAAAPVAEHASAGGFSIDGIVELWFTSAEIAQAGIGSAVSDRLIEDEPRFLSGLTGAPVTASAPAPLSTFALWFLGWPRGEGEAASAGADVAEVMAVLPGAGPVTMNELDPSGSLLLRSGLQQLPALPGCAISAGFTSREPARQAEVALDRDLADARSAFARIQVLTAEVVPIIEPAELATR